MRQLTLASNVIIKVADERDSIDEIKDAVLRASKDTSYSTMVIDEQAVKDVVASFVNADLNERLILLLIVDDKIKGFIAARAQPMLFNPKITVASETLWWVEEEYRRSRYGLILFDAFEEWASAIGASTVAVSHFPNTIGSSISKLYKKRGYKEMENAYIKELK
jgi:GNAT superfamily N-acetyltransferase